MTAQPNQNTVRNTAAVLGAMSIVNACDALRKIMDGITEGMIEHFGWDQLAARKFAIDFADSVVAEIRQMPGDRVLH